MASGSQAHASEIDDMELDEAEQGEFITPPGKGNKRKSSSSYNDLKSKRQNITLNNRFSLLNSQNSTKTTNTNAPKKSPKIPPFTVKINEKDKTYKELRATFQVCKLRPVVVNKIKNEEMAVYVSTIDDYRALQKKLTDDEFQFYTFKDPETTPPLKVVIRNLPINTDIDEIKTELNANNFPIENVNQMFSFREKEKRKIPLFLVTLTNNENAQEIFKLESVLNIKIKIENYIPPQKIKQCFKCQQFNHVSKNCHLNSCCVKCAGPHDTKQCTKPLTEKPKCANCNKDHTANYKGCECYSRHNISYSKAAKKIREKVNSVRPKNNPIYNHTEFPSLKKPRPTHNPNQWQPNHDLSSQNTPKPNPGNPDPNDVAELVKVQRLNGELIADMMKGKLTF